MPPLVRAIEPRDLPAIREELHRHWHSTEIWSLGHRHCADRLPGFVAEVDGVFAGLVTLHLDEGAWQCEVVTLSSRQTHAGIGSALLRAAEGFARTHGCRRIYLTTTNDNTHAIRFYQRREWRFSALHQGIVDRVRALVPDLPLLGFDGIQVHDELEFELWLVDTGASHDTTRRDSIAWYTSRHLARPRRAPHAPDPEYTMGFILTLVLSVVLLPVTLIASWVVVPPQQEVVALRWGKLSQIKKVPGLSWVNVWGRKLIRISTKQQAIEVHRTIVADGNGNPIVVAAVVTFRFVDSQKAALDVEDAAAFVRTQAMAVLKQVASRYPYESANHTTSLKSETEGIAREMRELLQSKVSVAGAAIASFELSDLSYAPEIARAMLVRQQAQALVDARRVIVDGAVQIVHHAIELLGQNGHTLLPAEEARLVSNLLVVICGESHVQPTVSMQSGDQREAGADERLAKLLEKIATNTTPRTS